MSNHVVLPRSDWDSILEITRSKTGKSALLTSGDLAAEIASLGAYIPDYVREEAAAVASAAQTVRTGKSLTFVSLADVHIDTRSSVSTKQSLVMAGRGVEALRRLMPLDAAVVMGDLTAADGAYPAATVITDWKECKRRLSSGLDGLTQAWVPGNHEINYGIGRDRSMTEDEVYSYVGANSVGLIRDPNYPEKNYGYIDFPDSKIRMICLNTADTLTEYPPSDTTLKASSEFVGHTQLQWLANTALNLSDKTDAAEWGIIFVSHHPLSYGGVSKIGRAMQIAEAYRDGTKGTITYTSDASHTVTYDFTSDKRAEIICNFCAHSHNYGWGYMRHSTSVDPWLLRICTPCINVGRENEHASNESLKSLGEFAEDGVTPIYWRKTVETRDGTSFCVNTIDRENKVIYSHAFGIGPDRVISYGVAIVTYTVTGQLTNCSISNSTGIITEGGSYTAMLTANSGYVLDSVTVTMGGADITSTAYSSGKITIDSVTGDVVITATAVEEAPAYTNWLDALHAGYIEGYRLSSGSAVSAGGFVTTNHIPCKVGDVIRIANVAGLNPSDADFNNHRISFYNASQSHIKQYTFSSTEFGGNATLIAAFATVFDDGGNVIQFTIPSVAGSTTLTDVASFRFCTDKDGITDASVVTVNEEIV